MASEEHQLIVRAVGTEEHRKLQEAVDKAREAFEAEVQAALKVGPAHAQASAAVNATATSLLNAEKALKSQEAAMARLGGSSSSLTQSLSTISYSLNDAQQFSFGFGQGIRAISNNIPGLITASQNLAQVGLAGVTTALSGPAGLILGLTALSSLVPLVSAHWGELEDWWSGGETSTEAERMDKLAKATERTADETKRLNDYKRVQSTQQSLETGESKTETTARRAFQEAVPELPGGFEKLRDALVSARNPQGLEGRFSPEDQIQLERLRYRQNLAGAGGGPSDEYIKQFEQQATERTRQAEQERASKDIASGIALPERRQGLLNELKNRGGAFLANQLEAAAFLASEEFKAMEEITDADQKASDARLKKRKEDRERLRKKEDELTDQLNKQGIENEYAGQEEVQKQREQEKKEAKKNEEQFSKSFGLDKLSTQAALGGTGAGEVEAYLRQRFGLSAEVAGQIALEGSRDASRQALEGGPPRRTSEVSQDITADVQRGVGGQDLERQSYQVAVEMRNALRSIDQNTRRDYAGRIIINRKSF